MRGLVAGHDKTPLKATQTTGSHPEDGSTMPGAVAVVQSHLATRWTILAKLFFGSAVAEDAMRYFGFVRTVTAGNVIAAHSAASGHAGNNDGVPIAVISRARKDAPIIATGSASTGSVLGKSEPA
jgi:hypothetical protein